MRNTRVGQNGVSATWKMSKNKMVLTKTTSSVSRQHKRDRGLVAKLRSNKICARRLSSLFSLLLISFGLFCVTHTLFLFLYFSFFFSLCKDTTIYVSMSHFFCLSFHTSLLQSFAQHTHTLTVGTLAQCFATLESHSR